MSSPTLCTSPTLTIPSEATFYTAFCPFKSRGFHGSTLQQTVSHPGRGTFLAVFDRVILVYRSLGLASYRARTSRARVAFPLPVCKPSSSFSGVREAASRLLRLSCKQFYSSAKYIIGDCYHRAIPFSFFRYSQTALKDPINRPPGAVTSLDVGRATLYEATQTQAASVA